MGKIDTAATDRAKKTVDDWFAGLRGTALSHDTEAYNQVHAAIPALVDIVATDGTPNAWFVQYCTGGPIARNEAAYEVVRNAIEALKPAAAQPAPVKLTGNNSAQA